MQLTDTHIQRDTQHTQRYHVHQNAGIASFAALGRHLGRLLTRLERAHGHRERHQLVLHVAHVVAVQGALPRSLPVAHHQPSGQQQQHCAKRASSPCHEAHARSQGEPHAALEQQHTDRRWCTDRLDGTLERQVAQSDGALLQEPQLSSGTSTPSTTTTNCTAYLALLSSVFLTTKQTKRSFLFVSHDPLDNIDS